MSTTSSRLLALLSLLQSRRDWSGSVLADRLEVSARTVRRDVDRLRELGYRIQTFKGPDGGYRLDAGTELPPLLFDDDQAIALAVSLQLTAVGGAGIGDAVGDAALRALTTLRQVLPSRLRHRLDALPLVVVGAPAGSPAHPVVDRDVLLAVGAAVHAGRCCGSTTTGATGTVWAGRATTRSSRPWRRAASSRTTWPPGADGGTSWAGTSTATSGAPTAPIG